MRGQRCDREGRATKAMQEVKEVSGEEVKWVKRNVMRD